LAPRLTWGVKSRSTLPPNLLFLFRLLFSGWAIFYDGFDYGVYGVGHAFVGQVEIIGEDGKRYAVTVFRGGVSGKRFHASQGTSLGINVALLGGVLESIGKRAVYAADRQRIAKTCAPRLGISVTKKLDDGMRSCQVLAGESGAVVESVLIRRDASLIQKTTQNLEAAFDRAGGALLPSQQAEKDFGMQILADFIDYPHVLDERLRLVAGQDQWLILQAAGRFVAATRD